MHILFTLIVPSFCWQESFWAPTVCSDVEKVVFAPLKLEVFSWELDESDEAGFLDAPIQLGKESKPSGWLARGLGVLSD